MNQIEPERNEETICSVCGQEGRRITCNSGSKTEVIFYHPKKLFRTVCHIATDGSASNREITNEKEVKQDETDAA